MKCIILLCLCCDGTFLFRRSPRYGIVAVIRDCEQIGVFSWLLFYCYTINTLGKAFTPIKIGFFYLKKVNWSLSLPSHDPHWSRYFWTKETYLFSWQCFQLVPSGKVMDLVVALEVDIDIIFTCSSFIAYSHITMKSKMGDKTMAAYF